MCPAQCAPVPARAGLHDDLNRIAEAGWRAPSAKNRQPWDFVIVTDRGQLQELSRVWQGAGHIAAAAAAIAFVVPEPPDERRKVMDYHDIGQAMMAMMIAATDPPLAPVRRPNRRPFGEVVHHGRW